MAKNLPLTVVYSDFASVALLLLFVPFVAVPLAVAYAWHKSKGPKHSLISKPSAVEELEHEGGHEMYLVASTHIAADSTIVFC
mmetsp:Transcript_939/g.2274  ORF Transcript_939/g.2274 Transcript_939/m.2274 type:complete len:83 (-) Transcript_939:502-750(-)